MKSVVFGPLLVSYCIEWLKQRPEGTTFHPGPGVFSLDGRIMAKIMNHDGNLMASPTSKEQSFYSALLTNLTIESPVIQSSFTNEKYHLTASQTGRVLIEEFKQPRLFSGPKPKFVEHERNTEVKNSEGIQ